jgi:hypothetical protein
MKSQQNQDHSNNLLEALKKLSLANEELQIIVVAPAGSISDIASDTVENMNPTRDKIIESKTKKILCKVGISANLEGHQIIVDIIRYLTISNVKKSKTLEDMYADIEIISNKSQCNIRRLVQYAIEKSWRGGRLLALNEVLGYDLVHEKQKPAIKAILIAIAETVGTGNF